MRIGLSQRKLTKGIEVAYGDLVYSGNQDDRVRRVVGGASSLGVPGPRNDGGLSPEALCIHPLSGVIYSSGRTLSGDNCVFRRIGDLWEEVVATVHQIYGLTFDKNGLLYIATGQLGPSTLQTWDGSSLSSLTIPTEDYPIVGLTWDWENNELIALVNDEQAVPFNSATTVHRRQGSIWSVHSSPGLGIYRSIAYDVVLNEIVVFGDNDSERYTNGAWVDWDTSADDFNTPRGACFDPSTPNTFEPTIDRLASTDGSDYDSFQIYLNDSEILPSPFGNQNSNLRLIQFRNNDAGDDATNISVTNDFSSLFEQSGIVDVVLESTYVRFELTGTDLSNVYVLTTSDGNPFISEGDPIPNVASAYVRLSLYIEYTDISISLETPLPIADPVLESIASLSLSDWDNSGFIDPPIVLAIIVAEISPSINITDDPPQTVGDADLIVGSDLSVSQVRRQTDGRITLRKIGAAGLEDYFDDTGTYSNACLFIQTSAGRAKYTEERSGSSFSHWQYDSGDGSDILNDIVEGTRFILAIVQQEIVYTDIPVSIENKLPIITVRVEDFVQDYTNVNVILETTLPTAAISVVQYDIARIIQTIIIDSSTIFADDTQLLVNLSQLIDTRLVVNGAQAYLRQLYVRPNSTNRLRTSENSSGSSFTAGPQLIELFEIEPLAIQLVANGNSVFISGPDAPGSDQSDDTEPYEWRNAAEGDAAILDFLSNYNGEDITVNLRANIVTIYQDITIDTETPLPVISTSVESVTYQDIPIDIETPLPEISFSVISVVSGGITDIAVSIETPEPIIVLLIDSYQQQYTSITLTIESPLPTIRITAEDVIPQYENIDFSISNSPPTVSIRVTQTGAFTGKYIWIAQRDILGSPAVGSDISDDWGQPIVIGAPSVDGRDGSDANGYEFVFARVAVSDITVINNRNALIASKHPNNSWGYDTPGVSDGLQWHDAAPLFDTDTPYLFLALRITEGQPNVGDQIAGLWSVPGLIGEKGESGISLEYAFSVYSGNQLPQNLRPLNSWGFSQRGTVNGLSWSRFNVETTEANPYLYLSTRLVIGSPANGTTVDDDWSIPVIISHYGIDGQAGQDGRGLEYIYTNYATNILPVNRYPLNSWLYDQPGTINSQVWTDGATEPSVSSPFLIQCVRRVDGSPNVGDTVPYNWRIPAAISYRGIDGSDGEGGEALEFIFARNSIGVPSQVQYPSNNWGYNQPGTRNGLLWEDGAPELTPSLPYLLLSTRRIFGQPNDGDQITDAWSTPAIISHYGSDGRDGFDGNGFEWIYTIHNSNILSSIYYPSNSWGYDQPGTVNGQVWTDGATEPTSDNPFLILALRRVIGAPNVGNNVPALWSTPVAISYRGTDGRDGTDGQDGEGLVTDPPNNPVLTARADGHTIIITWDYQENLFNLVGTRVQVAEGPNGPWYAPDLTGSGINWRTGSVNGYALVAGHSLSHVAIPLTPDATESRTLYYRVWREISNNNVGGFSNVAGATARLILAEDIADHQIGARKVLAGTLQALIAEVVNYMTIGDLDAAAGLVLGAGGQANNLFRSYLDRDEVAIQRNFSGVWRNMLKLTVTNVGLEIPSGAINPTASRPALILYERNSAGAVTDFVQLNGEILEFYGRGSGASIGDGRTQVRKDEFILQRYTGSSWRNALRIYQETSGGGTGGHLDLYDQNGDLRLNLEPDGLDIIGDSTVDFFAVAGSVVKASLSLSSDEERLEIDHGLLKPNIGLNLNHSRYSSSGLNSGQLYNLFSSAVRENNHRAAVVGSIGFREAETGSDDYQLSTCSYVERLSSTQIALRMMRTHNDSYAQMLRTVFGVSNSDSSGINVATIAW